MKFGEVQQPWWRDKPTVIVAQGPSCQEFDFERIRGKCYLLAVKASIFALPWADAGFGLDIPRYKEWMDKIVHEVPNMEIYWGADTRPIEPRAKVTALKRMASAILCDEPGEISVGGSSGYGGVNLAVHKKAKVIYLVGYDHFSNGKHFHTNENAYGRKTRGSPKQWGTWAKLYDPLAGALQLRGVSVWNASPESLITAFPKITLDEMVVRLS